jgi:hypothetical protein
MGGGKIGGIDTLSTKNVKNEFKEKIRFLRNFLF